MLVERVPRELLTVQTYTPWSEWVGLERISMSPSVVNRGSDERSKVTLFHTT